MFSFLQRTRRLLGRRKKTQEKGQGGGSMFIYIWVLGLLAPAKKEDRERNVVVKSTRPHEEGHTQEGERWGGAGWGSIIQIGCCHSSSRREVAQIRRMAPSGDG